MSKVTASRVALVAAFLTSLAGGIVGAVHTFPQAWQSGAVAIAGIIGVVGSSVTFAVGSVKFDQTPVGQAIQAKKAGVNHPLLAPNVAVRQVVAPPTTDAPRLAQGDDDPNPAEWAATRQAIADAMPAKDPIT